MLKFVLGMAEEDKVILVHQKYLGDIEKLQVLKHFLPKCS